MSQQQLVPIKNIKLAIDSMKEALEEKTPSGNFSAQFGILLAPSRDLSREQVLTYLNKCRQALSYFVDEAPAKMWFEVSLDNPIEKEFITCAQEKVNAKLAPPAPEAKDESAKKEEDKA